MQGVVVLVFDPRSLAILALSEVLGMVEYEFAMPIDVWRSLTEDRSSTVAFALHEWFEANRTRVRLLDAVPDAPPVRLGARVSLAVLSEDPRIVREVNEEGRDAVLAVSSLDLLRALEAGKLIYSADAVADAARQGLAASGLSAAYGRVDQARLKQRLFENLGVGTLGFA